MQVVSAVARPLFAPSAAPPLLVTDHPVDLAAALVAFHCLSQTVGLGRSLSKPFPKTQQNSARMKFRNSK